MSDTIVNNTKQLFGFMNKLFTNQIQMNQHINSMSLSTTDPGQNEIIKKVVISNNENLLMMNEMSQLLHQQFLQVTPPVSEMMIENRKEGSKMNKGGTTMNQYTRWTLFRQFLKKNSKKHQDYRGWYQNNRNMLIVKMVNGQETLYYQEQELKLCHLVADNAIATTRSSTMMNNVERPVGPVGPVGAPVMNSNRGRRPLSDSAMYRFVPDFGDVAVVRDNGSGSN